MGKTFRKINVNSYSDRPYIYRTIKQEKQKYKQHHRKELNKNIYEDYSHYKKSPDKIIEYHHNRYLRTKKIVPNNYMDIEYFQEYFNKHHTKYYFDTKKKKYIDHNQYTKCKDRTKYNKNTFNNFHKYIVNSKIKENNHSVRDLYNLECLHKIIIKQIKRRGKIGIYKNQNKNLMSYKNKLISQ